MKSIILSITLLLTTTVGICQHKEHISTKKAIADINFMINSIEEIHYNPYFKVDKHRFNQKKDSLINKFNKDSVSLKQFIVTGMKLAALMSGGHTALDWQNDKIIPELIPFKFIPFSGKPTVDKKRIIVTRSTNEELEAGMIVESINGIPIIELYKECMTYIGGIETFKVVNVEKALPLYLFFTDQVSAPYKIKLFGTDKVIETDGLDASELNTFISQNQNKENYTFEIVRNNIGIITYNSCEDYDSFEAFLEKTFSTIREKGITKIIIDIRENGGGDSSLNDLLLSYITTNSYRQSSGRYWKVSKQAKEVYKENQYEKYFGEEFMKSYYKSINGSIIEMLDEELIQPKKPVNYFSGKSCFLIGPNTFSSANFLADAVKTYSISTLIGTSTGELTNDFGEVVSLILPNSKNFLFISSTYDIGANGKPNLFEPVYPDIQTEKDALKYALDWMN